MQPTRPRPLFLVGNKRAGTTLMVNLLNSHPRVLVTHEADLVWIVHQAARGVDPIGPYPRDDAKGLSATIEACRDVLAAFGPPSGPAGCAELFHLLLEHINRHGRPGWDPPAGKLDLAWAGDKKPVQQCDPALVDFILRTFPDARFLHLVRDPRYAAASMMEAAANWDEASVPEYWNGTVEHVLDGWAETEQWVLELGERVQDDLHSVRLEDLSADPVGTMRDVLAFLELGMPEEVSDLIADWVWKRPNQRHEGGLDVPCSSGAREVMARYGYC